MPFRLAPLAALLILAFSANAAIVTITPSSLGPWRTGARGGHCNLFENSTASLSFVSGGNPLLGRGSVQLDLGSRATGFIDFDGDVLDGVPLGSLTKLSYSTYVVSAQEHQQFGRQAPNLTSPST